MNSHPRQAQRQRTISRRDFVLGRLWRQGSYGSTDQALSARSDVSPRTTTAMRYPTSLRDVALGDSPAGPTLAPAPLPTIATRRRTIPVLRPPGAIDEPSFLLGCTRCELCIQACPHGAIVHAPARMREAAGTPMIDADHQPCLMCADFPCISACEPGVLSSFVPAIMGTAKITEQLCLPYHGTSCTACSDACPVENAIYIREGKPTVNEVTCSGCGVCRSVCPAPENAILLMPIYLRPGPEGNRQPHE